eukprot:TRINITY_DN2557_c0_g1_i5.p1 TRINITY_DN2557_c0_g1~~TRINITY_DN2557_c0_g1_i5.p1  ORF type:complete len:576 (+),score=143.58 TRINITY_DN2557_c0_g1_i5:355-2082(+)
MSRYGVAQSGGAGDRVGEHESGGIVDGFWLSGDIVEMLPSSGPLDWSSGVDCSDGVVLHFAIVDRKQDLFKLAGGEKIVPSQLENIYQQCVFVDQILITCGDMAALPDQSRVSAIVVPAPEALKLHPRETLAQFLLGELTRVCACLRAVMILKGVVQIADAAGLRACDTPAAVLLAEPFTVENGLLTVSRKLARVAINKKYRPALTELLILQRSAQPSDLQDQEAAEALGEAAAVVAEVVGAVLGLAPAQVDLSRSLVALGGDSLSAMRISALWAEREGAGAGSVAAHLLRPKTAISKAFAAALGRSGSADDGAGRTFQLPADLEFAVHGEPMGDSAPAAAVLITGATGWIGSNLVAALLASAPTAECYCLVRGANHADAAARLRTALRLAGASEHDVERVCVLVGDIEQPGLGLKPEVAADLQQRLACVYHCAALVNHVAPLETHTRSNVDGVVNVLRLVAGVRHRVVLNFLSSTAVYDSATGGYGQSKVVGEQLFRDAAARSGHLFQLFRLGTVSWSQRTGQLNRNVSCVDWCVCLWQSLNPAAGLAVPRGGWHHRAAPGTAVRRCCVGGGAS